MGRVCSICSHDKRLQIDRLIVKGAAIRNIAERYNLPYHSVYSHSRLHIHRQLIKSHSIRQQLNLEAVSDEFQSLYERTKELLNRIEGAEPSHVTTALINELRATIETIAKWGITCENFNQQQGQGQTDSPSQQFEENLRLLTPDELRLFAYLMRKMNGEDCHLPSTGTRTALPYPSQVIDIEPMAEPAVCVPRATTAPRGRTLPVRTATPPAPAPARRNPYAHGTNEHFDPTNEDHQKQAAKERLEAKDLHARVTGDYSLPRLPR